MTPLSQPERSDIQPGTRLRCRDASDQWREKVATSYVEGCRVGGRLTHDFAGVYVRNPDSEGDIGVFWPLEDVEVIG